MILSTGALLGTVLVPGSSSAGFPDSTEKTLDEKVMYAVEREPVDLAECINLYDVEKIAKDKMSRMAYEYIASGAADEITVRWNKEVLDNIKLNPSLLVDVSKINTRITLLGTELPYPILIAPSAYHKIIHPDGELATAKGASAASALYVISSHTTTPLEEINKVASQPLWFQLYIQDGREFTRELVQKVIAQGCKALCITIDTPTTGCRDRQVKSKFKLPENVHAPYMHDRNMVKAGKTPSAKKPLTWKDIEWIKSFSAIPVVLKGIMNPLDADQAIKSGADAIIVSNHGGRNLDTLPATAEVMPRIADRVAGKVPLLMDGGIRRGTDVVKAIALGADAVLVGRPVCYGLGAGGAAGVKKVMDILKTELEITMTLCGTPTIKSIERKVLY